MQYNLETFSSDLIIERLVEWFNAQPIQDRTVSNGELFIVKVKVLANATGEPVFVIGTDPTASDPSREYIGEAVFLWIAGAGVNLTATNSSFLELSKTMAAPSIRTTGFVGSSIVSNTLKFEVLRMTAGVEYNNDNSPFAFALDGDGAPNWRPINLLNMGPTSPITGLTDISASNAGWVVGRKSDGTVWVWGENTDVNSTTTPSQVTLRGPARRVVALEKCLVALLTDGSLQLVGNDEDLPYSIATEVDWNSVAGGISYTLPSATDIIDIKGYHHYGTGLTVDAPEERSNYIVYQTADGVLHPWGCTRYTSDGIEWFWMVNDMAAGLQSDAPTATHYTVVAGRCGYCDTEQASAGIVGGGLLNYNGDFNGDPIKFALSTNGSAVAMATDGTAWVNLRDHDNNYGGWTQITGHGTPVDVEAGDSHVIVLWEAGNISEHTSVGMLTPINRTPSSAVRQIHAGRDWTAALLFNGSVQWWDLWWEQPQ